MSNKITRKLTGNLKSAAPVLSSEEMRADLLAEHRFEHETGKKIRKEYKPNIKMANLIVFCDVLNAVGSGMSLKFMDLFLIEEYGVSPIGILILAFVQNVCSVYLTPVSK